jgi:hypothetical protein
MNRTCVKIVAVGAILALAAHAQLAEAGFKTEIQVQTATDPITTLSNNYYFPSGANPGLVSLASGTTQNGITISAAPSNTTANFTTNAPGSSTIAIDEGVFKITNTSNQTVTVTVSLSDVSYNFPQSSLLNFSSFINSYSTTGTVQQTTVSGQIDNSTNATGLTFSPTLYASSTPASTTPVPFTFNDPSNTFTIITTIVMTMNAGSSVTIDAGSDATPHLSHMPAPSSVWLGLLALPVVGLAARSRRRPAAAPLPIA